MAVQRRLGNGWTSVSVQDCKGTSRFAVMERSVTELAGTLPD
jgi:hypothetical protein